MMAKGHFPVGTFRRVAPRLLADEMLGRLARYLRMMGCDTTYVRGWSDAAIVRTAREEGRTVLTRDRELASRLPGAVRIRSVDLPGQLKEVASAVPGLPRSLAFERCTVCNGTLREAPGAPTGRDAAPRGPSAGSPRSGVFACVDCGHRYWDGSHTAAVRRHLAEWIPVEVP